MTQTLLRVLFASATIMGCQSTPQPGPDGSSGVVSHDPAPSKPVSSLTPHELLDEMDTRVAVPLLPMMANHQKQNMRDHLVAVQEIVAAAAMKDFVGVKKAVERIGYSEEMGNMCAHMGSGAPGFTDKALEFHHSADKIGDAAGEKDIEAVWKTLSQTLATCTSCHATFKQVVVDDATWSATTNQAAPSQPMKHR